MECAYHPGRDAAGACVNCGKLICVECKAELGGKYYCSPCANEIFVGKKPAEVAATASEVPATKVEEAKKQAPAKGAPAGLTKEAAGAGGKATSTSATEQKISGAWWLMPIFLMWVGGIVAWAVNKEKAPRKARKMLIWGIVLTFIWWLIIVGINLLASLIGAGVLQIK